MALTVNLLNRSSTAVTAAQTATSGSFTPTANAKLYAFAATGGGGSAPSPSPVFSDSGVRTWTAVSTASATHSFGSGFGQFACCAKADVGASPASMTVTLDPYTGSVATAYTTLIIVEVVGDHTEVQHNQDSQSGATNSETLTLGAAATSGNLVLAFFDCNTDTPFIAMGAISGWTAVNNPTATSYCTGSLFSHTTFSSTSVTEATLGSSLSHRGGIILELAESGGGSTTITPGFIASGAQVFAPALAPGSVTITPDTTSTTAQMFAPTLAQVVAPGFIASTAQVFAPTLAPGSVTIQPGHIASTAQVFAPTVDGSIVVTPGFVSSAAQVFAPSLAVGSVAVNPGFIAAGSQVFTPSLSGGEEPPASTVSRVPSIPTVPTIPTLNR